MGSLPLHPAVVHFPIAFGVVAPIFTLLVWLLIKRGHVSRLAWWAVVIIHALSAGSGALSMKLGEREEERVEKIVGKESIHEHEESAEAFVKTSLGTLGFSAVSLFLPAGTLLEVGRSVVVLGSGVAAGFVLNAGHSGGELVYEKGAARAYETR